MADRLTRRAPLTPATLDRAARTVRATISTGAAVDRGRWIERLDLDRIDPSDLVGRPVVDGHRAASLSDQLGVVIDAGRDNGGLWADIKISNRHDPILDDISDGMIRGVSIGYQVSKWNETRGLDGRPVRTAVDWSIVEVSLTPMPADAGAIVRSIEMDDQTTAPAETDAPAPADTETRADPGPVLNRVAVNREIRTIASVAGLTRDWADQQIDSGADADTARRAAFEELARRTPGPVSTATITRDHTDPNERRTRMAGAIAARFTRSAPADDAREFMHHSVADMAADLANTRGARLDSRNRIAVIDQLFSRSAAHTTSDFPLLLQDAAGKILLPAYTAAEPTYRKWAAQRQFADFKAHKFLRVGDFPALAEINEGGEVTYGTLSENREQVTAKEYGSGFAISRRALINDDLGAFADYTSMIAVRVAQDENALAYAVIASNGPTMADGVALFHADHGNKDNTSYAITAFETAVAAMRGQTSLDGIYLNVRPKYIVGGIAVEGEVRSSMTVTSPTTVDEVNVWAGMCEVVIDPNVSGNRWHVFADPMTVPSIVYGYVGGASGPQVRSEIDFDTRALRVAVGLDFAVGAIDHRGCYLGKDA